MIQSNNGKEIYIDTLDSPKGYKEFVDLVHQRSANKIHSFNIDYINFLWMAYDPRYYKLFIRLAKKVIKKAVVKC